jgi:2-keto-4-pentenoate hydratase
MSALHQAERFAAKLLKARVGHQSADVSAHNLGLLDETTAMRIQQLTLDGLRARVSGWKVAILPDGAVLAAPVLDFLLYRNAAAVPERLRGSCAIECEIGFRIGQALPARVTPYNRAEVTASIASVHPAVETLHSRLPLGLNSPRYAVLVDMLSNAGLIVGEAILVSQEFDFANILVELVNNNRTIRRRLGGLPSGGPLGAVVAFANHLQRHGRR